MAPSLLLDNHLIRTVMAPMVGQSDAAFRMMGRNHGCDLCFTQMIHAKNFLNNSNLFKLMHLDTFPVGHLLSYEDLTRSQQLCLQGLAYTPTSWPSEGPLIVQLAGNDSQIMIGAAQLILELSGGSVHGIDVNLGCPQDIARRGQYGAWLAERDPNLVCAILTKLRESLPTKIAVSAKMRLPRDHAQLERRVLQLLDTGISFLTVHGRTLDATKNNQGACRINLVQQVVEVAQKHTPGFPVICNGGIETLENVDHMLQVTGAAACMASEALLENPTLFEGPVPSGKNNPLALFRHQMAIANEYLDWCTKFPPIPSYFGLHGGSFSVIRSHLFKICHRYLSAGPQFREVLSSGSAIPHARQFLVDLERHFTDVLSDSLHIKSFNGPESSWYRRHWNAAATARISLRHGDEYRVPQGSNDSASLSVEERKKLAQERLQKAKQERFERQSNIHVKEGDSAPREGERQLAS